MLEQLERQHQANPDNVSLGYYLASMYQKAGRLKQAESQYQKLLKTQPLVEAYTGLARAYFRQKHVPQLLQVLSDYAKRSGATDLDDFDDLAKLIANDDKLLRGMIKAAGGGIAKKTTIQQAIVLALLHVQIEKWDEVRRYFTLALANPKAPKAEILRTWALELMMAGQYDESAELLRRALRHENAVGEKAVTHYLLSGVLEYDAQTDAALVAAREATRLRPSSPYFAVRSAWILYHAKRYPQARQLYLQFLKEFDTNYETESVREIVKEARNTMSNICVATEDFDGAERWLEEILDEFPDDIGTLNDLGYLWADGGKRLERSLSMIRRAVQAEPDNVAYLDSLGWVLFRLGRFEEATVELEKATQDDPDGVILDHLAEAYHRANQPSKALATWRRAAELFGEQGDNEKKEGVEKKIERLQTKRIQTNSDNRSVKESK